MLMIPFNGTGDKAMAGLFFTAQELQEIFGVTRSTISTWVEPDGVFSNAIKLNPESKRPRYIVQRDDVALEVEKRASELEEKAKKMRDTFDRLSKVGQ